MRAKQMTEKSKQWVKEYGFNALTLALLLIILSMVGYYLTRIDGKLDKHEDRIGALETISYNLGQSCINYNEWQRQHQQDFSHFRDWTQAEILELWKMSPRGVTPKQSK